ncbi:hypothetical protein [Amycolatopsis taiwanensis]|uniref:hypothetical protein n=1 Tax=Amycolatopsis taiwanensis TaxID=342230 RepID=UPI0004BB47B5|nr:hypothetical protein [Amycolatopsis taiwanensis]
MADQPSILDSEDGPRDFAAFLLELARGKTHRELSEALAEIAREVVKTKKQGKLQLTLVLKPQPAVEGAIFVSDEIKSSVPKFDRPASIFFATDLGDLVRTDPNQPVLFTPSIQQENLK